MRSRHRNRGEQIGSYESRLEVMLWEISGNNTLFIQNISPNKGETFYIFLEVNGTSVLICDTEIFSNY